MKHRLFLIATALFACVLGGMPASAAEEARKIEQFIAKNVDRGPTDFAYFYRNTADSDYLVTAFLSGRHGLYLSNGKENAHFGVTTDPAAVYTISRGDYFIVSDIFSREKIGSEFIKRNEPLVLIWRITNQDIGDNWSYTTMVNLARSSDSNMDLFLKRPEDGICAEIVKLLEGNNLSFAVVVGNGTGKTIALSDLFGSGNQVKLKFPNGRVFTPPLRKDAESTELKPGESKTFKIELEQLLKESKDFSMKDFEFGLTEFVWELKLDKGQAITRNFWLVKFNGELPKASEGSGYKLDGPLTMETFRDKKVSALPAPHAYFGNKDIESETKETSAQSEEK